MIYHCNPQTLTIEPVLDGVSKGVTQHKAEKTWKRAVERLRRMFGKAAVVIVEGDS